MRKRIIVGLVLVCLLAGCGGVEPERRAYPLVLGIDWLSDRYQIIYGMPDLSASTGQDKSSDAGSGKNTLLFTGNNMKEILQIYNRTQEKYLDMGHVQAVVLGEHLLDEKERYQEILAYLEQEPTVGDSAVVFQSGDPKMLMELNGSDVESLGTYLVGIYENRLNDRQGEMVTLRDLYRSWHEEKTVRLPNLDVAADFPRLSA